jgi:DNA-binding NarL/FixJ family response regulator
MKGNRTSRASSRVRRRDTKAAPSRLRPPRCRVLLVDGHVILRLGLKSLLNQEPDLEVVADADSADAALQRLAAAPVDLVVTDIALPGRRSGLELLVELRDRFPHIRALVLTDHRGYEYARASFAAGAAGYTLKSASQGDLLAAIRAVWSGDRFVNPTVASQIIVDYLGSVSVPRAARVMPIITRRERDVLTRVASGRENREIAAELGLSVWTVRKHRQNLMRKFALRNSAAVTAFAIRNGLVASDAERLVPETESSSR